MQVVAQQPQPTYVPTPSVGPPALYEGWVNKRSVSAPGWLKNWRRRYLRLTANRIEWRKSVNEGASGSMHINARTSVSLSAAAPCSLELKAAGQMLVFECSTDQAMRAWFDALSSAISAHLTRLPPTNVTAQPSAQQLPISQPRTGAQNTGQGYMPTPPPQPPIGQPIGHPIGEATGQPMEHGWAQAQGQPMPDAGASLYPTVHPGCATLQSSYVAPAPAGQEAPVPMATAVARPEPPGGFKPLTPW